MAPEAAHTAASRKNTVLKGCSVIALPLLLSACSWSWFGLNSSSSPRAAAAPAGSLSVAPAREFAYMPALDGRVSPNRIENTAMTGVVLKSEVRDAVRESVANHLKVAGFHLDDKRKVLSGRIEKFSVDDVRSPALWTLQMRYVVTDASTHQVVFSTTKTVKRKSPKFTSNTIAIEDTVKLSVDALVQDAGFIKAVN
nr:hypothetical protein [Paraburkholderia phenoliruptrix]